MCYLSALPDVENFTGTVNPFTLGYMLVDAVVSLGCHLGFEIWLNAAHRCLVNVPTLYLNILISKVGYFSTFFVKTELTI